MPKFWQQGDVTYVSYITGPTHVILGLAIPGLPTKVESIPGDNPCCPPLDEGMLRDAVFRGIADEGGPQPGRIIYYTGDTPDYNLYRQCARLLARRIMEGDHGRSQEEGDGADRQAVVVG